MESSIDLAVIIPTFNEEGSIRKVIETWMDTLRGFNLHFRIHIYDGGSKDQTLAIIEELQKKYDNLKVSVVPLLHGPSILKGYCENLDANWIFQIDGDDEIGTKAFTAFWSHTQTHDFIVGRRFDRKGPLTRQIVSRIAYLLLNLFYAPVTRDVNCPYRLMRSSSFRECYMSMPQEMLSPNLVITGYAARKPLNTVEIDVDYKFRETGVAINKTKLIKIAMKSFWQVIAYRFTVTI